MADSPISISLAPNNNSLPLSPSAELNEVLAKETLESIKDTLLKLVEHVFDHRMRDLQERLDMEWEESYRLRSDNRFMTASIDALQATLQNCTCDSVSRSPPLMPGSQYPGTPSPRPLASDVDEFI